ncbi:phage antirepressor [Lacticaseibacillus paracasei]|uniref:phage antirepressor n=1 Tax=Lacticaseibacillus paracasei TaxID=1597 RepID=UPI0025A0F4B2|nr:phage antirepressor KilAC domain-containing protein [Lacticaseibacillus paracasei]MDM7533041.1 phage antirepressor KilAC domain-containing protein [Lacticaseibacillus paracasei]
MNQLQHFDFKGRQVRTVVVDNEPMFVGKDIAEVLGYSKPANAVNKYVPDKFKGVTKLMTPGGKQDFVIVSEAGLYKLVFKSGMPNADEFTDWVAAEVLPSIRKHGAYMTPETIEKAIYNPDFIIYLATQLKDEQAKTAALTADNETMKPKALFADAVATSHTTILVGDLAKVLKQNGVDIGAKRLFAWLREQGYLIKRIGADYNSPTQRAMELGLFEVKETAISHSDGHVTVQKTPKVTGKGQQYFINKFLQKEAV